MKEGLINLDFADVRAVMREMGKAMMGTGEAEGDKRALTAAEAAISNPLIDDASMKGARGLLISITDHSQTNIGILLLQFRYDAQRNIQTLVPLARLKAADVHYSVARSLLKSGLEEISVGAWIDNG